MVSSSASGMPFDSVKRRSKSGSITVLNRSTNGRAIEHPEIDTLFNQPNHSIRLPKLRSILREPARVCHRQRHQILRLDLPQSAAQAIRLAELDDAIGAHGLGPQHGRHRMPAMALELARRAMIAGDDE